jgi:ketosteroid isomerase-like protein
MPARSPEELDRLFATAMNAGNLEAIMALYEPGASLGSAPGRVVTGTAAIRRVVAEHVAGKPKITVTPKLLAQAGDIALVATSWSVAGTGGDGKPFNINGQAAEVCRRQKDGTWLYVIDYPYGLQ